MRALLITLLASTVLAADPHAAPPPASVTGDEALAKLVAGNKRFSTGEPTYPNLTQDRRCETFAGGQHPYATILSCADSRVPPEMIFDAGIGDLFVIRVAGNVSDTDEIATIEYGAGHLGTPLIVVMGHAKCGAVTAVVDGAELHGNLAQLVDNIVPASEQAKKDNPSLKGAPLVAKAIRANVYQSMQDLLEGSDTIRELVKEKKVTLVGALYDLHSGQVEMIGAHPREAELLTSPGKHSDPHAAAAPSTAHEAHGTGTHSSPKTEAPDAHVAPKPADPHAPKATDPHTPKPADAHGGHSAAPEANPDEHAKAEVKDAPSLLKLYGPIAAFVVGSIALSCVVIHLIRR